MRSVLGRPVCGFCWMKSVAGSAKFHSRSSKSPSTVIVDSRRRAVTVLAERGLWGLTAPCASAGEKRRVSSRKEPSHKNRFTLCNTPFVPVCSNCISSFACFSRVLGNP